MRVLSVLFFFVLASVGGALAGPGDRHHGPGHNGPAIEADGPVVDDFLGTWHNVEVRKTQVVRIVVTPTPDPDEVIVHIYGLRHGEPASFGSARGVLFRSRHPREREQDNAAILVKIRKEFVYGDVLVRFNGRGEIVSHALLAFENGRRVYSVERFEPVRQPHGEDHLSYNNGYPNGYKRFSERYYDR